MNKYFFFYRSRLYELDLATNLSVVVVRRKLLYGRRPKSSSLVIGVPVRWAQGAGRP